jgi:hypothetical protein
LSTARKFRTAQGFPRALLVATHTHTQGGGDCPIMGGQGYIVVYDHPLSAADRNQIEEAIWGTLPGAGTIIGMTDVTAEFVATCPHAALSPPLVDPARAVWVELNAGTEADAEHLGHLKDIVEPTCRTTAAGQMHLGGEMPHVDLRVLDVMEPAVQRQMGVQLQLLPVVSEVEDADPAAGYHFTVYFNSDVTAEAVREALMGIGVFLEPLQ